MPACFDYGRLRQTLLEIKKTESLPSYTSYELPESTTINLELNDLKPIYKLPRLVLVEGILIFDQSVLDLFAVKIFMHGHKKSLKQRREGRSRYLTAGGDVWEDPPEYFEKILWPCYLQYNKAYLDEIHRGPTQINKLSDGTLVLHPETEDIQEMALRLFNELSPL